MEEALAERRCSTLDVILADGALPGTSGVDAIPELRRMHPVTTLVVRTVYDDNERVFEALCAGANGYLLRDGQPPRLLASLAEAAEEATPIAPETARQVLELFRRFRPPERAQWNLSHRELRLLHLLTEGYSYASAAAEMKFGVNTVDFYMKSIYNKVHVHSKSVAVARAVAGGIFCLPKAPLGASLSKLQYGE